MFVSLIINIINTRLARTINPTKDNYRRGLMARPDAFQLSATTLSGESFLNFMFVTVTAITFCLFFSRYSTQDPRVLLMTAVTCSVCVIWRCRYVFFMKMEVTNWNTTVVLDGIIPLPIQYRNEHANDFATARNRTCAQPTRGIVLS